MIAAVVYTSETGFTEKYAKWISSQLACDCFPADDISAENLRRYGVIIYGGWIYDGVIQGLKKFLPLVRGKKLIVFGVGALPESEKRTVALASKNKLADIPFFYFTGGVRFDDLTRSRRNGRKALQRGGNRGSLAKLSDEVRFFRDHYGESFDNASKSETYELVKLADDLRSAKPGLRRAVRSDIRPNREADE